MIPANLHHLTNRELVNLLESENIVDPIALELLARLKSLLDNSSRR